VVPVSPRCGTAPLAFPEPAPKEPALDLHRQEVPDGYPVKEPLPAIPHERLVTALVGTRWSLPPIGPAASSWPRRGLRRRERGAGRRGEYWVTGPERRALRRFGSRPAGATGWRWGRRP